MKIFCVVGTRPNFMKIAPVYHALQGRGICGLLVHTGQHYDEVMSEIFIRELNLPVPDIALNVGAGSPCCQVARIIERFETAVLVEKPSAILVAGDVNSTLACALAAAKLQVPVAHLEAGLRSFDRTMPEEVNRVMIDQISDVLLTPSEDADQNLKREGIPTSRIFRVGNAMIDSLRTKNAEAIDRSKTLLSDLGLEKRRYAFFTVHRPANVDEPSRLEKIVEILRIVGRELPVVFPMHPRTRKMLEPRILRCRLEAMQVTVCDPVGYVDSLALQGAAQLVLTDSGGVQEETTALGVPCLTLRENTERPVTLTEGTNTLVGLDPERVRRAVEDVKSGGGKRGRIPDLWDGHAGHRAADVLCDWIGRA